jgi:hypothetical protein
MSFTVKGAGRGGVAVSSAASQPVVGRSLRSRAYTVTSGGYPTVTQYTSSGVGIPGLTRTFGTPTNASVFTLSAWVKMMPGQNMAIFGVQISNIATAYVGTSQFTVGSVTNTVAHAELGYTFPNGQPYLGKALMSDIYKSLLEYTNWHHFVFTQNGGSVAIYWDNALIASGSVSTTANKNFVQQMNTAGTEHFLASSEQGLTEVTFVDGQSLTPSSFAATDPVTGMWSPTKYTGSFGNNGCYLDFKDNSALTTTSNVGLGKDTSGNGNYWQTNSAVVTSDSSLDHPLSNYGVFSKVNGFTDLRQPWTGILGGGTKLFLPYAYLTTAITSVDINRGKYYWEIIGQGGTGGVTHALYNAAGTAVAGTGKLIPSNTLGFTYNSTTGELRFTTNGTTWTTLSSGPYVGPLYPGIYGSSVSSMGYYIYQAGQVGYNFKKPSGFLKVIA